MRKVSFQGTRLSASERHRIERQKSLSAVRPGVDWNELRETINSRMFVGPKAPVVVPDDVKDDWYWKIVDNFSRYGYCEYSAKGTPCVAEMLGF